MASRSRGEVAIDQKWKAEEDLRCVQIAAEVKKDPKRQAAVKKLIAEKLAALKTVAKG